MRVHPTLVCIALALGFVACTSSSGSSTPGTGGSGGSARPAPAVPAAQPARAARPAPAGPPATGGASGTAGLAGTGGRGGAADAGRRDGRVADAPSVADTRPGSAAFPRVTAFDVDACHDLDIAVSPTLVAVATNPGLLAFYNKNGTLAFRVQPFMGPSIGDAHVVWDQSSRRWFFSTLQSRNGDGAFVYASLDETGRRFTPDARLAGVTDLDNPQLVVTTDKVSMLVFDNVYTMDKATVMAGQTPELPSIKSGPIQHTDQTYGVDYGAEVPSTAYFTVMSDNSHFNWISVDGTFKGGNVVLTQHKLAVSRPFTAIPPFPGVTAFGNRVTRNSGNLGMWDRGRIVWSQSGRCGADVCPRVFLVDTTANTMVDFDLALPGNVLWSAATGFDRDGNLFALMAQSSGTTPLGLAVGGYSNGGALIPPQPVVKGTGLFPAEEFGDFFAASQDPPTAASGRSATTPRTEIAAPRWSTSWPSDRRRSRRTRIAYLLAEGP
jgi:hypothetical protein